MHLHEYTLFDPDLGTKATHNIAKYPLHHVTYLPAKLYEVATCKIHSHMKDINLIDSCQVHLAVQHASNIEFIR